MTTISVPDVPVPLPSLLIVKNGSKIHIQISSQVGKVTTFEILLPHAI